MIIPKFFAQKEWTTPSEFPDLRNCDEIAIDLETRDPDLKNKGSGSIIGNGEVVGIAAAVQGRCWYFPIAHGNNPNMDRKKVLQWFKDTMACPATKIFHNAMYDVCWLKAYGVKINGHIVDTMVMAALVDENKFSYALNSVSYEYLGEVKDETALKEAAFDAGVDPKAEMWKLPDMYVGSYAEKDAELTLKLFKKLSTEIKSQDLTKVFDLETQLFPGLIEMKIKGVRVDVQKAHTLKKELASQEETLLLKVKKETGIEPQIWAARSIAKVFDKLGLEYERTKKTQAPSFTKNFLQEHTHPLVQCIAKARETNKAHTTFIDTIIKHQYKGRIHADINPIRGVGGGTVTGRFSYSNPNLQQIPARNKQLGPMIRSLFIPEHNHKWGCFDYSQQEPRLVVHYALKNGMRGAENLAEQYQKNPTTDFHALVSKMAKITRKQAKTINLGLFYGMGKNKLARSLELDNEESKELFDQYHREVPFVRELSNGLQRFAERNKNIFTLEDRFCRFDKWEPIDKEWDKEKGIFVYSEYEEIDGRKQIVKNPVPVMNLKQAKDHYLANRSRSLAENDPNCEYFEKHYRPAFTYKALNRLIQGSAADMTKKAMVLLYEKGIVPHIQIHDELCLSIDSEEKASIVKETMEKAIILLIPNKVNYKKGKNWGTIKEK